MMEKEEKTVLASTAGDPGTARLGRSNLIALAAVFVAFLGTTAAIAAVYFQQKQLGDLIQLEHQDRRELVRVQTGLEMTRRFDSPDMRRNRREIATIMLSKPESLINADWRVFDFFETLAQYHFQHRIDSDTVDTNFAYYVTYYWEIAKGQIVEFRKQENEPRYYADFEELYKELTNESAMVEKKSAGGFRPRPDRMKEFLKDEAALTL